MEFATKRRHRRYRASRGFFEVQRIRRDQMILDVIIPSMVFLVSFLHRNVLLLKLKLRVYDNCILPWCEIQNIYLQITWSRYALNNNFSRSNILSIKHSLKRWKEMLNKSFSYLLTYFNKQCWSWKILWVNQMLT